MNLWVMFVEIPDGLITELFSCLGVDGDDQLSGSITAYTLPFLQITENTNRMLTLPYPQSSSYSLIITLAGLI